MGYKKIITQDLVCDHCGKIYENFTRSSNEVLLNKALIDGWKMDNNEKIYCPECIDKKVTTELKFYWPNFYRMSCVEQSIQNSGNNQPIKNIRVNEEENKLYITVDLKEAENFTQMDWRWTLSELDTWQKTSHSITVILPDKQTIYNKCICDETMTYINVTEFIFSYKDKVETIF